MKFRKIIVDGVEYGWRVAKSADNIEVRGPSGRRVYADAEEVTGIGWYRLHTEFEEFDRHHGRRSPFYVKYPITPRLIAAWIVSHRRELAEFPNKALRKTERYPAKRNLNFEAVA